MDFPAVNSAALAALRPLVLQWIPGGAFRGNEYVVSNPTRQDKTAGSFSINVVSGIWKDFSNGDGGKDPISLFAYINHLSQGESCARLSDIVGVNSRAAGRNTKKDYPKLLFVAPDNAPEFPASMRWCDPGQEWHTIPFTHCWAYHSAVGGLLFYVARSTFPDGSKQVKPYCLFRAPDGDMKWISKAYPDPRPMYNLDRIAHAPCAHLIVVEGEKCAQTLQGLIDGAAMGSGLITTTWQGGANASQKTDWTPARGRSVILWPDNDDPGIAAMHTVGGFLKGLGCKVKQIRNPEDKPQGWDCADAILIDGWNLNQIFAWIQANKIESQAEPVAPPPVPLPSKHAADEPYGPVVFQYSGKIDFNQSAIAYRYVKETSIIQDPRVGRFYRYEAATGLWRYQSDDVTGKQVADLLQVLSREVGFPELLKKRTAGLLQGLTKLAKGYSERPDAFSGRPTGIHVRNGVLTITPSGDVDLHPFAMEHYSRNRSEIDYDPTARCPRFLAELMLSAMPAEDVSLIQRYMGQCLLGDNPSQTFLILRGTPGGGKGALNNIIETVIGRHNTTELRMDHLDKQFEIYRYLDKTLLCGKDVPGDFLNAKPAHAIKKLVGGDQLTGEAKHGNDSFIVMGRFNAIITTNTRLRVRLDSDYGAWRRRMLIVDYERPAADRVITNFGEQLIAEEGPGILAWAVEGAVRLLSELNAGGRVVLTETQQKRVDDLLYESDSCQSFVRDVVVPEPTADVSVPELTAAYHDYCERKGWQPLRERAFLAELPEAMLAQRRAHRRNDIMRDGKHTRGFIGYTLRGADGLPIQSGF